MSSDQILIFTDDMDATMLGVCLDRMAHPGGFEAPVKDVPGLVIVDPPVHVDCDVEGETTPPGCHDRNPVDDFHKIVVVVVVVVVCVVHDFAISIL
jgi:hypothetical protein